jgi:hypothetical protein
LTAAITSVSTYKTREPIREPLIIPVRVYSLRVGNEIFKSFATSGRDKNLGAVSLELSRASSSRMIGRSNSENSSGVTFEIKVEFAIAERIEFIVSANVSSFFLYLRPFRPVGRPVLD